jgi:hypothetical protein
LLESTFDGTARRIPKNGSINDISKKGFPFGGMVQRRGRQTAARSQGLRKLTSGDLTGGAGFDIPAFDLVRGPFIAGTFMPASNASGRYLPSR